MINIQHKIFQAILTTVCFLEQLGKEEEYSDDVFQLKRKRNRQVLTATSDGQLKILPPVYIHV